MKPVKKYFFLALIVIALLFFGFYRDFIFKKINALMQAWDANIDYKMPVSMQFLENFEYATLEKIKWVLTLIFSGIYLLISLFAIKTLFNKKKYAYICIGVYIAITIVSGFLVTIGLVFHSISDKMYEFARYLMGMVQSPVVLMILIPAFILAERETEKNNNSEFL